MQIFSRLKSYLLPIVITFSTLLTACSSEDEPKVDLTINIISSDSANSINISNSKTKCSTSCQESFLPNTVVNLSPTTAASQKFNGWSDQCAVVNGQICQILMKNSKSVTATFSAIDEEQGNDKNDEQKLSINITGQGTIAVQENNQTCNKNCIIPFDKDSIINLSATPDNSSQFNGWSGECISIKNDICQVSMTQYKSVTATFSSMILPEEKQIDLSISVIGDGTITIEELELICGKNCQQKVIVDNTYLLKAIPSVNSSFVSWNKDTCDDGELTCTITIINNSSLIIKPVFSSISKPTPTPISIPTPDVNNVTLTLNFNGGGTGTVFINATECSDTCELTFPKGQSIDLSFNSPIGNVFSGWEDCSFKNVCQLTLTANKLVDVVITQLEQIPISVNVIGNGSIALKQSLNPDDCTEQCTFNVYKNQNVTLITNPDDNNIFSHWSNTCGSSSHCSLNTTEATSLTATFITKTVHDSQNFITITEPKGVARVNYPVQFARPFIKGEIANFPQITIDGTPPIQQVNIKQRHDDGSVKHAIFNVILDNLPASSSLTLQFSNKDIGPDITPITKDEMLSDTFNFDARMSYKFNDDETIISARDLISNDHIEYWLTGPVATTLILRDNSIAREYDLGSDSHRSIRPIFYVTFWKNINQYSVRFVNENINTETLQDQLYDISLFLGESSSPLYQKNDVPHKARTRWTKQFTSFTQEPLSINHNLKYLIQTYSIPNFDTNRTIPEITISESWNLWQSKPQDLYDQGFWQKAMGSAGGRPDIGLYPTWVVQWLYTGDWRLREMSYKQSELTGAWPMHYREGDNTKTFNFEQNIPAIGKIISIAPGARPSQWTKRPDWYEVKDEDKITPVTSLSNNVWVADTAHHPDIASPQFLLSGDHFFLEQMLFSLSYVTGDSNAKAYKANHGRGPTGAEGGMYSGQTRGQAWHLRTRVHTYDILPDDYAEKTYVKNLLEQGIALWEGKYLLTNSQPSLVELYDFASTYLSTQGFSDIGFPSPIGQWTIGTNSSNYVKSDFVKTDLVGSATAPWMQNMVVVALGRAAELGWPTHNLLAYASKPIRDVFLDDNLDPTLIFAYVRPTANVDGDWIPSWSDVFNSYSDEYKTQAVINAQGQDGEHGYYSIAMAAASYCSHLEKGPELWGFIQTNVQTKEVYESKPKWALVPR